jgi:hypothetical protein
MIAYRLVGWHSNIDPRRRNSSNMSDGAIFSTPALAEQYASEMRMYVLTMRQIERTEDDPEVDHLIKSGSWKPVDHG